ncbi:MAG: hypothetical protein J5944_15020 [Lentisphaeria bacterium]|nr:hypothetical protein [Lentisphaeria bacterium]
MNRIPLGNRQIPLGRRLRGDAGGSMLMEYVIVVMIVLLGGSLAMGDAGTTLIEMAGVSVSEENNFGLFGGYIVDWIRRVMWMLAQPFP